MTLGCFLAGWFLGFISGFVFIFVISWLVTQRWIKEGCG
jgi:hypothetical protein